jgi:hypothetical protein
MRRVVIAAALLVFASGAWAQQPPVRELVEDFRIDGGEHEFTNIYGVLPLRTGNVLVGVSGDFAATLFSPTGEVVRKFARKGAGPGEIERFSGMGLVGDTIWMTDRNQPRVTFFALDGSLIGSTIPTENADWAKLRPDAKGAFIGRVTPRVLMSDGTALGSPGVIASAVAQGQVTSIPLVHMRWNGAVIGIVAGMPVRLNTLEVKYGDRVIYSSQPFPEAAFLESSPNGRHIALVEAQESPRPVIRVIRFNAKGDTVSRLEIPYTPIAIQKRSVDSAITEITKRFKLTDESPVRSAVHVPRSYSPVQRVLMANDGTLWIEGHPAAGRRVYTLVSPQGKIIEKLTVPLATTLVWVDGSIWATSRDADDVPSVVRLKRR